MGNRIDVEPNVCPENTIALTCGIDPSEGGFFVDVLAWQISNSTISGHLVDYRKIFGWDELEKEMPLKWRYKSFRPV